MANQTTWMGIDLLRCLGRVCVLFSVPPLCMLCLFAAASTASASIPVLPSIGNTAAIAGVAGVSAYPGVIPGLGVAGGVAVPGLAGVDIGAAARAAKEAIEK